MLPRAEWGPGCASGVRGPSCLPEGLLPVNRGGRRVGDGSCGWCCPLGYHSSPFPALPDGTHWPSGCSPAEGALLTSSWQAFTCPLPCTPLCAPAPGWPLGPFPASRNSFPPFYFTVFIVWGPHPVGLELGTSLRFLRALHGSRPQQNPDAAGQARKGPLFVPKGRAVQRKVAIPALGRVLGGWRQGREGSERVLQFWGGSGEGFSLGIWEGSAGWASEWR